MSKENIEAEAEEDEVTAALLVIGDEILSGRTADQNINYIASHCTKIGIRLQEVRVVSDDETRIVEAVNHLRAEYDYLFTTGGIGPTHDDITAQSVASALGVLLEENKQALELMLDRYPDKELTPARRLMARVPIGASLIKNTISAAPGFIIENVIVMAGVPKIMQVMLDDITPSLKTGLRLLSRSVVVDFPESGVADCLKDIETRFEGISIGSYPYFRQGKVGTVAVMRGTDEAVLELSKAELIKYLEKQEIGFTEE